MGDLEAYYPRLIEVGETVVRLAGNATEYVLVVALRHIIATELERADARTSSTSTTQWPGRMTWPAPGRRRLDT